MHRLRAHRHSDQDRRRGGPQGRAPWSDGPTNRILDEVLLNPDDAALFLKEHSRANRVDVSCMAKLRMGHQASPVVDLIDGEDDEVEHAAPRQ